MTPLLEQFVIGELFAFLLIFCRIGAAIMLLPGIGEIYIPSMSRLGFALLMSLLLMPMLSELIPPVPISALTLGLLIIAEILIGLFFGFFCRLLINTLHIAGTIIAYQSSLAIAAVFDATLNAQSTVVSNFLTISAVVFFFTTDMHHLMLSGVVQSYDIFAVATSPFTEDMANHMSQTVNDIFRVAIQISAAHLVFGLVFYLGSGILARLMPTMQVFFVLMPPQIIIGFLLLAAMLNSIMIYFAEFVETSLFNFLEP